MSQDLSRGGDAGTPPEQQQQSAQRTGAGACTAMEAMLKKRRMQTREPDPAPAAPQGPGDAGKTPPGK